VILVRNGVPSDNSTTPMEEITLTKPESPPERLRVAIDAQLASGEHGGVEQVVIGLASGLSALQLGAEEYYFMVRPGQSAWLEPYIAGACRLLEIAAPEAPITWRHRLVRAFPRLAAVRRRLVPKRRPSDAGTLVSVSDGVLERGGFDLVHFTKQYAFLTDVPSIYHPHDLQHLHLPEFFSEQGIRDREANYRAFCEQATMVTVTSQWGKRDLMEHYGLAPEKIVVVPLAPAIAAYECSSTTRADETVASMNLPADFVFYPAQTWPHKNHLRLIEALSLLNHKGMTVPLVCSGRQNEHFETIRTAVESAGLSDLVHFVGFVSPEALRALYGRARMLVMPTLFEAAGGFGPIAEAFAAGVPVACSNVTSLPEEVGTAALLFDPYDVGSIADAVERLWSDAYVRELLAERGRVRISDYTWDRVARVFRAHYRRISRRPMSDEDVAAIAEPTSF